MQSYGFYGVLTAGVMRCCASPVPPRSRGACAAARFPQTPRAIADQGNRYNKPKLVVIRFPSARGQRTISEDAHGNSIISPHAKCSFLLFQRSGTISQKENCVAALALSCIARAPGNLIPASFGLRERFSCSGMAHGSFSANISALPLRRAGGRVASFIGLPAAKQPKTENETKKHLIAQQKFRTKALYLHDI